MTLWSSFIHYNSSVTRRDWEKDYSGGGGGGGGLFLHIPAVRWGLVLLEEKCSLFLRVVNFTSLSIISPEVTKL